MSTSKAQATCNNLGITCKMSYVYSSKTKGIIFNQSMSSGSKVIDGTTVVLTVSNGPKPTNNSSSSGNQSNGGNSGSSNQQPIPSCVEKGLGNLVIQESWLILGNANKTIASLKSKLSTNYPGATFNIIAKEHNDNRQAGMVLDSSPTSVGTPIVSCKTYTIYIAD